MVPHVAMAPLTLKSAAAAAGFFLSSKERDSNLICVTDGTWPHHKRHLREAPGDALLYSPFIKV